jgi:hypothetical protein
MAMFGPRKGLVSENWRIDDLFTSPLASANRRMYFGTICHSSLAAGKILNCVLPPNWLTMVIPASIL